MKKRFTTQEIEMVIHHDLHSESEMGLMLAQLLGDMKEAKKTLEFYATKERYYRDASPSILEDMGQRAAKTLEELL